MNLAEPRPDDGQSLLTRLVSATYGRGPQSITLRRTPMQFRLRLSRRDLLRRLGLPAGLFSSRLLDSLFQIGFWRRRGSFAQRSHFGGELRLPLPDPIHDAPKLAVGPAGDIIEGHKH